MPVSISSGSVQHHRYKVQNYEGAATTDAPNDNIPPSTPVVLLQTQHFPPEYGDLPSVMRLDLSKLDADTMENVTEHSGGDRIARLVALSKISNQKRAAAPPSVPAAPYPTAVAGRAIQQAPARRAPARPVVAPAHEVDPDLEEQLHQIARPRTSGPDEVQAPDVEVIFVTPVGNFSAWYHDVQVTDSVVVLSFDTRARGSTAFMPTEQVNPHDPEAEPEPVMVQIPSLQLQLSCLVKQALRWRLESRSLDQCLLLII